MESELLAVNDLISKSPNFAAFLGNPTISRQEKANKVRSDRIFRIATVFSKN